MIILIMFCPVYKSYPFLYCKGGGKLWASSRTLLQNVFDYVSINAKQNMKTTKMNLH